MRKIFGHSEEPSEDFSWDEETGAEDYTDEGGYTEEGYTGEITYDEGTYAEDGYTGEITYDEGTYAEDGYTEEGYTGEVTYDEGAYAEDGYTEEGYTGEVTYDEGAYAEEGYTGEITYDEGTYAEEGYTEEGYTGEITYDEGAYAEEGYTGEITYDEGAYAEEGYTGEITYDEGTYAEEGYTSEIPYVASYEDGDEGYAEEEDAPDEEEDLYDDAYDYDRYQGRRKERRESSREDRKKGFGFIDAIIALTGVAVILLGVVVFIMYQNAQTERNLYADFITVGAKFQNIDVIGGKGIAAVADAALEKIRQENNVSEEEEEEEYEEKDPATTIAVAMLLTSVQKDLKIKFSNRETSKLVGNVRFAVEITKPDGSVEEWVDSDMDGIIYEKNIAAGKYMVSVKELEEKYSNFILPTNTQTVNVRRDIEYSKVDVTGEGKKESEVNVGAEDTGKKDPTEESTLKDTVTWVPSTVSGNSYIEVLKSAIPDPLTIPLASAENSISHNMLVSVSRESLDTLRANRDGDPTPAPTENPTPTPTVKPEDPTPTPTVKPEDPTPTPTVKPGDPTPTPTASPEVPTPTPTVSPEVPTPTPTVTPDGPSPSPEVPTEVTLELDLKKVELRVIKTDDGTSGEQATVQAKVKGVEKYEFFVSSKDKGIATAAVDDKGKVTIIAVGKGETTVTVKAEYSVDETDSKTGEKKTVKKSVAKDVEVVVAEKEKLAVSLDTKEVAAYSEVTDKTIQLVATITNSDLKTEEMTAEKMKITATVTDSAAAKAVVKEVKAGDKKGTAIVTIQILPEVVTEKKKTAFSMKYTEGEETAEANCAVNIYPHPKNDKTTKLLNSDKQQLYVFENNEYREAVYADYYTDAKFFLQAGIKYTGWQTIEGKTYFYTAEGKYVTGEQVILGAKYVFGSDGVLTNSNGVLGIDVSKWNGTIDWKAVKNSGVHYVIIRCGYRGSTQGMLIEDPKFNANIKGATEAGLKVGVYFFSQAVDEVEAVYEASYVLDKIKNYKITYPVFLDVEPSGGRGDKIDKETRTRVCRAFCQTIQNGGYTAGIYANKNWLEEKLDPGALSNYKIWLAQYAAAPTYTGRYDMWQYKATGTINGISGNVDLNLSYMGY